MKTDRLVDAFVEMAVDVRAVRGLPRLDRHGRAREGPATRTSSRAKAGEAGDPRTDDREEEPLDRGDAASRRCRRSGATSSVARGQLDLIENSFQLIADQIVTMQSPQELSGQLDELLDGVEAIRQTAQDTEKILSGIGIEREM